MSKIVSIKGKDLGKIEPNTELVAMFENALAQAKSGDLRAAGIILVDVDSRIFTKSENIDSKHLLLAGCLYLQHDICAAPEK